MSPKVPSGIDRRTFMKVAAAGAFLIDAETRLNPSLAAAYFGSNRGSPTGETNLQSTDTLTGLSPQDRELALKQKVCPVTLQSLGSMGPPIRLLIEGEPVLICCAGCEAPLRKSPAKYLAKLP